ncbi:ribbon-helix-helix domain-containing protein [Sphaerospermopsis aphanizomenoides]|uniref:ribbon-helix-helix domain-containing protein n=1 Tax=Sphaerospermopsis aphanizomenoides TaxID=459663 RepID=UPI002D80C4C4|nr:type II toxin-antitoxin system ParD family antitoxin [Sphaerospermopsis aphanizomenoides]
MIIHLNSETEQLINYLLATGNYQDVDDIIDKALMLLIDRERRLEELRQKIDVGLAQIKRGEVVDGEVVMARLEDKIRKAREEKERQELLESANEAYTELRNNSELWEQTLSDGLEE